MKQNCHAELADLRTVERSENRIASRLSLLEQSSLGETLRAWSSSLGETLRAWSKSKTVSASVPCRELPLTLARFRNKFIGMILKEIPSLRAVVDRVAIQSTNAAPPCHSELVSESVPRYERVSNVGQTLNQVQGDKNMQFVRKCLPSLRAVGFTMAEILLSLTIIGVVATITLPSLTGNINERTWNTQRKALYARMSQAIALMPAINGYGTLKEESSAGASDAVDTAAETFVTNGLAKVLKINNICDSEHLEDCGITSNFTNLTGSSLDFPKTLVELNPMFNGNFTSVENGVSVMWSYSQLDTKAAAFETANGESIAVFYNPGCVSDLDMNYQYVQAKMCANFIYDLNGNKGPNTVGKDIGFMSILYPTDSVVAAPLPVNNDSAAGSYQAAIGACNKMDTESRLPNKDELSAIFFNKNLVGIKNMYYWSGTVESSTYVWSQNMGGGNRKITDKTLSAGVRCIKR